MFEITNPSLIQEGPRVAPWKKVTPLVLIHDGGGTVFSYHCLGPLERLTYGIANPRYSTGEPWEGGIPEVARHYLKLIKTVVPRGKLILGGWSLGGLISIEIARLIADDPALSLVGLLMIDSVFPSQRHLNEDLPVAQHAIEWNERTRPETRDCILRCFKDARDMVDKWTLPTWGDENPDKPESNRVLAPPPTILLRAELPVPVIEEGVSRVDARRNDPLLGWSEYRKDLITDVIELPRCHHFNIFAGEEALDLVTTKINKACRDLDAMHNANNR
ncbi:Alpha/Beta hydrolase protein [Cercophora newfieldiana]|uniref:Alpha/Beta hydrolase protein n=1 Tax=Cercophora newfieldiana TaxID=92897 RepID=A0AA39YJS8_9PEZI|nr:Alpha/Beta hydrolase protein [Cercophora newfieldiana]